jgi:hypothetical protein
VTNQKNTLMEKKVPREIGVPYLFFLLGLQASQILVAHKHKKRVLKHTHTKYGTHTNATYKLPSMIT